MSEQNPSQEGWYECEVQEFSFYTRVRWWNNERRLWYLDRGCNLRPSNKEKVLHFNGPLIPTTPPSQTATMRSKEIITTVDVLKNSLNWLDKAKNRCHTANCSYHMPSARCTCGLHRILTDLRGLISDLEENLPQPISIAERAVPVQILEEIELVNTELSQKSKDMINGVIVEAFCTRLENPNVFRNRLYEVVKTAEQSARSQCLKEIRELLERN